MEDSIPEDDIIEELERNNEELRNKISLLQKEKREILESAGTMASTYTPTGWYASGYISAPSYQTSNAPNITGYNVSQP